MLHSQISIKARHRCISRSASQPNEKFWHVEKRISSVGCFDREFGNVSLCFRKTKKNTRYAITCDVPTGPDSLATTSHRKPLSTLPSGTWTYLCPSVGTTLYDGGPGQPAACRTLPRKDRGTCLDCEHWFFLDAHRSRRGHRQQHQSPDLIRKGESGERKIGVFFSA